MSLSTAAAHRLYFAYGSNLSHARMQERCPESTPVERLTLSGWKLLFRCWADIVPCKGSIVEAALYRVASSDIDALDRYENVARGIYHQVELHVRETDESILSYVMNDTTSEIAPSREYLAIIEQGYSDWGIPLDTLRKWL